MVQPANRRLITEAAGDLRYTKVLASTQPLLRTLTEGLADAAVLTISDSTGFGQQWPYLTMQNLAAMFPKYTLKVYAWNDATQAYDAPTTVQTGTGTPVLSFYNLSINGKSTGYALGAVDKGIVGPNPDLVFISHAHNEDVGETNSLTPPIIRAEMLCLTETVSAVVPNGSIVLIGQNPNIGDTKQATRIREYQKIAQERGYGFIDVHAAFYADPRWSETQASNTIMSDAIHPNTAGQQLWTDVVTGIAWKYSTTVPVKAQPPSSLTTTSEGLSLNGDFSKWTGATPDGWTVSGGAVEKDFRYAGNPSVGYGARVKATGAAPSYMAQRITGPALERLRGKWITVATRVTVSTADTSTTAGSVAIFDDVNSTSDPSVPYGLLHTRTSSVVHGVTRWVINMRKVSPLAPFVEVRLYANKGNVATADTTFDQVHITLGSMPRLEARPVTSAPVLTVASPAAIPSVVFVSEPADYGLADGASVVQMTDSSGLGNHATQATGANRATLATTTDAINGKAVAVFTANQFYTVPVAMPVQVTEYVVFNNYSTTNVGSLFGNAGGTTNAQFTQHTNIAPGNSATMALTLASLNAAGNHILCLRYDYTNGFYHAWFDGKLVGSIFSGKNGPGAFVRPTTNITLGSWRGNAGVTDCMNGKVAGYYIANRAHSDAERRGVLQMLATRFGITLADTA